MFGDIDLLFFGGWLRGNACVTWSNTNGLGGMYGCTKWLETGKCRIFLNPDMIWNSRNFSPFETMWVTMLHEMWYVVKERTRSGIRACDSAADALKAMRT